jgi:hypothetical protein
LPVIEASYSVFPTDAKEFARIGIVGSAGQLPVDRFERCGINMHDNLAFAGDRLREFLPGRCVFSQDPKLTCGE